MTTFDLEAERVVLGCAIDHPRPCARILSDLTAGDFYYPNHRRLFEILPQLDGTGWAAISNPRVKLASRLSGFLLRDVIDLVQSRPVLEDLSGSYTRRVLAASERRRLMLELEEKQRLLAEGADIAEVMA